MPELNEQAVEVALLRKENADLATRMQAVLRTADPNQWDNHPKTAKLKALVAAQEANLQELAKQHNAFVEAAQVREAETQKALQSLGEQLKIAHAALAELRKNEQRWIELPEVRKRLIREKQNLKSKVVEALDKEIQALERKDADDAL